MVVAYVGKDDGYMCGGCLVAFFVSGVWLRFGALGCGVVLVVS